MKATKGATSRKEGLRLIEGGKPGESDPVPKARKNREPPEGHEVIEVTGILAFAPNALTPGRPDSPQLSPYGLAPC